MELSQANNCAKEISRAWPSWTSEDRQALLRERLIPLNFERTKKGIQDLVMSFKGQPTIAHILEGINHAKVTVAYGDCTKCRNLGWVQTDDIDHGTYRQCECDNQNRKVHDLGPKLTSEGKPVISPTQGQTFFERGLRKAQPSWTDQQITKMMETTFPSLKEVF